MSEILPNQIAHRSQFALFRERRFWPLFTTQFFGAFNDNAYKSALLMLFTFGAASWSSMKAEVLTNLAAGLFILPFFLFSATSGQLADKFDKARLARLAKALEIAIVALAALGFYGKSLTILLLALFLLGLQSTLFGPVKYAILPQHLTEGELVGGNALVEAGTFIAILLGTVAGGFLITARGGMVWIIAACFAAAIIGYWASRRIPDAPAPAPEIVVNMNPLSETWRVLNFARGGRSVFLSILGISWFWGYGSLLLTQFPVYTRDVLRGDEFLVTALLAIFSIGVGAGSLLCDRLTRRCGKLVEPGLVPLGALGMALAGMNLALIAPDAANGAVLPPGILLQDKMVWRALITLFFLGFCGGIYCVPLYALVQRRSEENFRARIIAANNVLNAVFMVISALFASVFLGTDLGRGMSGALGMSSVSALFMCAAILHGGMSIYIFSVVPEFLRRAWAWIKGRNGA
ncbi:MAG: MFS transporter [Zoogloeaceae bacterium]|jgi:MFS family permease|nr:MFS transporter [Zoogloeaceae bacterium]